MRAEGDPGIEALKEKGTEKVAETGKETVVGRKVGREICIDIVIGIGIGIEMDMMIEKEAEGEREIGRGRGSESEAWKDVRKLKEIGITISIGIDP